MRRVAHARPVRAATAAFAVKRHRHTAFALATAGVAVLALAGCAGGASAASDETLRIAMGSPGEAQIAVWDAVAETVRSGERGLGGGAELPGR